MKEPLGTEFFFLSRDFSRENGEKSRAMEGEKAKRSDKKRMKEEERKGWVEMNEWKCFLPTPPLFSFYNFPEFR